MVCVFIRLKPEFFCMCLCRVCALIIVIVRPCYTFIAQQKWKRKRERERVGNWEWDNILFALYFSNGCLHSGNRILGASPRNTVIQPTSERASEQASQQITSSPNARIQNGWHHFALYFETSHKHNLTHARIHDHFHLSARYTEWNKELVEIFT